MACTERVVDDGTVTAIEHACRSAVGDRLRSVTLLTTEGTEHIYRRSDLPDPTDDEVHADAVPNATALADGGRATWAFEDGFVTRVRVGETGVIVTSDGLKMDRGTELSAAVRGILSSA